MTTDRDCCRNLNFLILTLFIFFIHSNFFFSLHSFPSTLFPRQLRHSKAQKHKVQHVEPYVNIESLERMSRFSPENVGDAINENAPRIHRQVSVGKFFTAIKGFGKLLAFCKNSFHCKTYQNKVGYDINGAVFSSHLSNSYSTTVRQSPKLCPLISFTIMDMNAIVQWDPLIDPVKSRCAIKIIQLCAYQIG